jgi:hypothetical protein
MATMPAKISLFVFVPFYGLFALVINHFVIGNRVLWIYLFVVFNRMRFAFFNADEYLQRIVISKAIFAAIIWVFLTMFCVFLHSLIPSLGLNEAFIEKLNHASTFSKMNDSEFIEMPKVPMCIGAWYYLLLAFTNYKITHSPNWQYNPDAMKLKKKNAIKKPKK